VRFAALALLLTGPGNAALPAQEPAPASNLAGAFRRFLRADMETLGQLVTLRDQTKNRLEHEPEGTQKHAYYQKVVDALAMQIEEATRDSKSKADELQELLSQASLDDYAAVMRLREWEIPPPTVYLQIGLAQCAPGWRTQLAADMTRKVREVAATGSRQEKTVLCILLAKEVSFARASRPRGIFYCGRLKAMTPVVIALSQLRDPEDRLVRQAAATALAQLQAPPEDQVNAFQVILDVDCNDVESRRAAFRALSLPFSSESHPLAVTSVFLQDSRADPTNSDESHELLDKHARLVLPLFAKGLKDTDVTIRQLSIQACKDMAALVVRALNPAPTTNGLSVVDDGRVNGAYSDIKRIQFLLDAFAQQSHALIEATSDPDQIVRLQALSLLNDLAEVRNRIGGWQACFDLRETSDIRLVAFIPDDAKHTADVMLPFEDKLTPTLRLALDGVKRDLTHPDRATRLAAIEVLETMDQTASDAIEELVSALQDRDPFVLWTAVRIFNRLGPVEPTRVVPALIPLIRPDQDSDLARPLAALLSKYGSQAAPAVPALTKAIGPSAADPNTRIAYLQALSAIGYEARGAIPAIAKLLEPLDAKLISQASRWPAAFVISETVVYDDVHVRVAAAEALGYFGELATDAEPRLRAAMNDANPELRQAAGEALLRIRGNL
jgi:hypothetical protein